MKLKSIPFYLKDPRRIYDQIKFKIWLKLHPDVPWISPEAVKFLDHNLKKDMTALEWGSGRSSSWYAKRVGKILSIEHNLEWFKLVNLKLKDEKVENAKLYHIKLDHPESDPTSVDYDVTPKYVAVAQEFQNDQLDFVVVDGHYRLTCVKEAIPKIKPGGLLLIDNTNWLPLEKWGVPSNWSIVHRSSNGVSETTIWRKA